MTPDQINGCFGVVAGILLLLNVIRLHRDKQIHGVHVVSIAFMAIWGFWNLYFYPYIGAPWSLVGGIVVVVVNSIWVGQMIYYKRKGPPWRNYTYKYTNVNKEEVIREMRKAMFSIKLPEPTGAPLNPIND